MKFFGHVPRKEIPENFAVTGMVDWKRPKGK